MAGCRDLKPQLKILLLRKSPRSPRGARAFFSPQQCYRNLKMMRPATATKRRTSGKYHYRRQSFQLLEDPISPDHGNLKC